MPAAGPTHQGANPRPSSVAAHSLRSMTGYAQAQTTEDGWSLRISVRSVNHRFLDLRVHLPEGFELVEPQIRQTIRERVRRGHLDVTLHYDPADAIAFGINQQVAAAYLQAANLLRKQFGIQSEPDVATILRLPGVIGPPAASLDEELARLNTAVTRCLSEALDKLDHMREQEARALREEMTSRLGAVARLATRIAVLAERAQPAFARRLESRLKDVLGDAQLDPARIAQEAAIAAERSDVSEELARLKSHVQQFETLLSGAPDVGKKLDFLLQEMQRETNTLLSKAPGAESEGLEITQLALEIKSEIEKLREQVQNIE